MRVKTESKRQEILGAASSVFLEQGYERTQMAHISERARCSKGTLYSYFASKDELFFAVVIGSTEQGAQAVFGDIGLSATAQAAASGSAHAGAGDILLAFGTRFLATLYAPRYQALRRLALSEGASAEVRRTVYHNGIARYESQLAALLAQLMQRGQLRQADTLVAAAHLRALLESELLLKFLLGVLEDASPATLQAAATRAISAFTTAYAPGHCSSD